MSVWRSDFVAALNEAILALDEAANLYRTAMDRLADKDARNALSDLADKREHLAGRLRSAVEQEDDIPNNVPGEKLLLQTVLTHLRAVWADRESDVLLDEMAAKDAAVLDALSKAQCLADGPGARNLVSGIKAQIESDTPGSDSLQA